MSQVTWAELFGQPHAIRFLPSFAGAAIADPVAARALERFIGPPNEKVPRMRRNKVPGAEHFARTWSVIKPGMLGQGRAGYAKHTRADHERTRIPAAQIALPIQWLMVMLAEAVNDLQQPNLHRLIRPAGERFARDIAADLDVVRTPLGIAKRRLWTYFQDVRIAPEQGMAFWAAMDHPVVRRDLGGKPGQSRAGIMASVGALLHPNLVLQYRAFKPS